MNKTAWFDNQPDGEIYIGTMLYQYKGEMPENTTYTVREGTTGIVEDAFNNKQTLVGINIPDSVKWIGPYAFSRTGLTEIALPKGLEKIGKYAFSSCNSLTELTIPKGVKVLPQHVADDCSIYFEEGSQLQILAQDSITSATYYLPGSVQYFMRNCLSSSTAIVLNNNMNDIKYIDFQTYSRFTIYASENVDVSWAENITSQTSDPQTLIYMYSEFEPEIDRLGEYIGSYWHYDANGNITVWE